MSDAYWKAEVKLPWVDHPMAIGPFGVTVYPGETHTATASAKSYPVAEWYIHGMAIKAEWLEFISEKVLLEDRSHWFNFIFRGQSDVVEIRRET